MIKEVFKFTIRLITAVMILFFLIVVNGCLATFGITILTNKMVNTVNLTNIAFAMFVGIASTIFSWSRSIENDNPTQSKQLNRLAIKSFMCAFLFAIGSLFKYTMMQNDLGPFQFLSYIPMNVIMSIVFFLVIFQVNVILTELHFIWISEKVIFKFPNTSHGLLYYIDYARTYKQRIIDLLEEHRSKSKTSLKDMLVEYDNQERRLDNLTTASFEECSLIKDEIEAGRYEILVQENVLDKYFDDMINWVSQNPIKAYLFPSLLERIKPDKTYRK